MTGVRPDVTKLSLHDKPSTSSPPPVGTGAQSPLQGPTGPAAASGNTTGSDAHARQDLADLAPNEPGPLWRLRNSTLGEHYVAARNSRSTEAPRSPHSPHSPHSPQPGAQASSQPKQQHLKPAGSSASVSSMASQRSAKSGKGPTSVVELKRFFGKGRNHNKHDKPESSSSSASSKKGNSSKKHERGLLGSLFFRNKAKRDKKKNAGVFELHDASDGPPRVRNPPPADLDPKFVIDAPDYETWDPFDIFGLGEDGDTGISGDTAERLPFLESEITKYGQMGKDMGSGAGGNVRMMERPSDHKLFAVKEFRARKPNETVQKYAKHVTAEYALGAAFHHEHIIETIDLIKEGDKYYEVMEYGPNDFFALVMSGSMTTPQVNSAFHQIVSGVHYLHSMGVAHRDLKLDNCVVTLNGVVKLIDFGSAVVFKYPTSPQIHLARGIMGSDPYLAPEVFERRPYQPQCADIWSCGIIYCCIYLRRFPWKLPQLDDVSYRKFAENPANTDGNHPHHNNPRKITGPWRILRLLPMPSRRIISRILTVNVENRATMETILSDPWFSSIKEISVLHLTENHVSAPGGASEVAAHA